MRVLLVLGLIATANAVACNGISTSASTCTCTGASSCKYKTEKTGRAPNVILYGCTSSGVYTLMSGSSTYATKTSTGGLLTAVSGCGAGSSPGGCPSKLTKEDETDFASAMVGGVWAGNAVCIILLGLTGSVICCGKMLGSKKLIGGMTILMGIINFFVPFIASTTAASAAVDKTCKRKKTTTGVDCDQACKDAVKTLYGVLGFFFAYLAAFGWLNIVLGVVAISLGGAACCGCCKAKEQVAAAQTVIVTSAVVPGTK